LPSSEARATLPATVALHARPAGTLVREAARFGADISVAANGKRANAKSILEVLALGATGGTELLITASGADAAAATDHLAAVLPQLS
jgi:phosphotransferase system HPr (HPr) family protein